MDHVENLEASESEVQNPSVNGNHNGMESPSPKQLPKLCYSREFLLKLKDHPKSKTKPTVLDSSHMVSKMGLWDPEHWMANDSTKRPLATTFGAKDEQLDKAGEKKRVRDEGDEFCFTPQRRSFVSGCHVVPSRRQEPEPAPLPHINENIRESSLANRRVGSGRITSRDSESSNPTTKDNRDRRDSIRTSSQRERPFEREQRSFPSRPEPREKLPEKDRRNYERSGGYDREYNRNNRFHDRRKQQDEGDTPEWFLGGPTSQHDTIELRGFDEEPDKNYRSKSVSRKEITKEKQHPIEKEVEETSHVNGTSRPESSLSEDLHRTDISKSTTVEGIARKKTNEEEHMDFNIEEILQMDPEGLNGLGLGQTDLGESSRGSRLSRWFSKTNEAVGEASNNPTQSGGLSGKEEAARSLLEMLHQGAQQSQPIQSTVNPKKILTAEELERSAVKVSNSLRNQEEGMTAFNKFLAQVQDIPPKPNAMINNAPTEQEILANLLGDKMSIGLSGQQKLSGYKPVVQQDALSKFLQQQSHNNQHHQQQQMQQQSFPFQMPVELQQQPDIQAMMRDVANGLLSHPQALQQLQMLAVQHRQMLGTSPQQITKSSSSSSPLSFTPTAVMRKMTAEKDKDKAKMSHEKIESPVDTAATVTSSPCTTTIGSVTSNRLTGRTASQVQGAARVSSQLGLNEAVTHSAAQIQQQQQLLTGRPLVKGQEGVTSFPQQHLATRPPMILPFNSQLPSNAAITGVAVKLLEQQQQQMMQQQRTSPLQHSLLGVTPGMQPNIVMQNRAMPPNVPVGNRTHFRPIHPQPLLSTLPGYTPYGSGQAGIQQAQHGRTVTGIGGANQHFGNMPVNLRGQNQGVNHLAALQQNAYSGNRSPNMLLGNNPLARWFSPEILSQAGAGQIPSFPPMPSQKILSLEDLERQHTSPMSH